MHKDTHTHTLVYMCAYTRTCTYILTLSLIPSLIHAPINACLCSYLQAAPSGTRISVLPWEYLDTGTPSFLCGDDTEQGQGCSEEQALEAHLGGLMNDDSSIAVAAKVGT
jgi:hypothetical protein